MHINKEKISKVLDKLPIAVKKALKDKKKRKKKLNLKEIVNNLPIILVTNI